MSFQLVPKSVTLNDLERRNGRYNTLRYFTEFGTVRKPALQETSWTWRNLCKSLLYF